MTSFDGIMSIFHYEEKFLKILKTEKNPEKIHEKVTDLIPPDIGGLTIKSQN